MRSLGLVLSLVPDSISEHELLAVAADPGGVSSLVSFLNTRKHGKVGKKTEEK